MNTTSTVATTTAAADYNTPADQLAEMITARRAWLATHAERNSAIQAHHDARKARIATYAQYRGERSTEATKARQAARELEQATANTYARAHDCYSAADRLWADLRFRYSNAIGQLAYAATAANITAKHDHEMLAEHYAETDDDRAALAAYYAHHNQQTLAQWEAEAANAADIVARMEHHGGTDALRIARERQAKIQAQLEQARAEATRLANAERQAERKNRAQDAAMPLFAYAGLIEQVAERWTADRHMALQAGCRESMQDARRDYEARTLDHIELYMEVCQELTDPHQMAAWTLRCNTAGFPKRTAYIANFWYERLKDALGLAGRCACGGIWVCAMNQPRRSGDEPGTILDWYCADCKTPAGSAPIEQPKAPEIVQYMAAELLPDEQPEPRAGLAAAAAQAIEAPTVTSAADFAAINAAQLELAAEAPLDVLAHAQLEPETGAIAEATPAQIQALLLAVDPARLSADAALIYGIVAKLPTARRYYDAVQAARSLPADDDREGYYDQFAAVALAANMLADLLTQAASEAHPQRAAWKAYLAATQRRARYSNEYSAACTVEDQTRQRSRRAWQALTQSIRPAAIERAQQRNRAALAERDEAGEQRSIAARYYLISAEIAAALEDHYFQLADAGQQQLAA